MDKKNFRKKSIKNLQSIPKAKARLYDYHINRVLGDAILNSNSKNVMLYVPLSTEVNVLPLINTLRRRKIRVFVPFMEGESFRLVQYRLPLKIKKYGVQEPNFSKKYRNKMIDIAIVPIVGTDASRRRIGFGKGMYDRFFAQEKGRIQHVIFVQRILQFSEQIVTNHWDIQADELIAGR